MQVKAAQAKNRPYTIVFVGVNGVGKSTNLAKIAYWLGQNDVKARAPLPVLPAQGRFLTAEIINQSGRLELLVRSALAWPGTCELAVWLRCQGPNLLCAVPHPYVPMDSQGSPSECCPSSVSQKYR